MDGQSIQFFQRVITLFTDLGDRLYRESGAIAALFDLSASPPGSDDVPTVSGPPRYIDNLIVLHPRTESHRTAHSDNMPPKYSDGSFRTRSSGTLEYRFHENGINVSVYGNTKQECFDKRTEHIRRGALPPTQEAPFAKWLFAWAERYKKNTIEAAGYKTLLHYIHNYIAPGFAGLSLSAVTADFLQDFLTGIDKSNTRTKVAAVLSESLRYAAVTRQIPFNPYLPIKLRKKPVEHFAPLMPDEEETFFAACDEPHHHDLMLFAACTGTRIGEALGVRKCDIDIARHVIYIRQGMTPDGTIKQSLKTKASRREVPFHPALFSMFKSDLYERLPAEADPNTRLFQTLTHSASASYITRLHKRAGFLHIHRHSMRHTFISHCYQLGILPKQIQIWVGHSRIETTLNTYTHIFAANTPSMIKNYLETLCKSLNLLK
jgi:integrase